MIELVIVGICVFIMLIHIHSQHNPNPAGQALQMKYLGRRGLEQNARNGVPILLEEVCQDLDCFSHGALTSGGGVVKHTHTDPTQTLSVDEFMPFRDAISRCVGITEGDPKFLEEVAGEQFVQALSSKLSPYLLARQHHRYLSGPLGSKTTPSRSVCDRNYVLVAAGTVSVTVWSAADTSSMLNVKQDRFLAKRKLDKMSGGTQFLVGRGSAIFVPKGWWWSIEFGTGSGVVEANYQTAMNVLAHPSTLIDDLLTTWVVPEKYTSMDVQLSANKETAFPDSTTPERVDGKNVESPHDGERLSRTGRIDKGVPSPDAGNSATTSATAPARTVTDGSAQSAHDCEV